MDGPFEALIDLMFEHLGFHSTQGPLGWVRSLIGEAEWQREQIAFPLPEGTRTTKLYVAVDAYGEK